MFGPNTLLVPLPSGQPTIRHSGFSPPTPAIVATAGYQLDLAERDIALAPGHPSGGLCALVIPHGDDAWVGMLTANPALQQSLRVEHPAGMVLFLRPQGTIPASVRDGGRAWLGDGALLTIKVRGGWTTLPPGPPIREPANVRLAELDWRPLGTLGRSLLRDALLPQHGELFDSPVAARGRLNLRFWPSYLLADLRLRFHARRGVFEQHDAVAAAWVERVQAVVLQLADRAVRQATAEWGSSYHPRPVELRRLVAQMKVGGAVDVPDAREFIRQCLVGGLIRQPGANVTGAEVLDMIARRHQQDGRPIPSRSLAGRWINELVFELFSAPQHRNLKPNRKWARGFRGLRLREDGDGTANGEPTAGKAGREQTAEDGLVTNKMATPATTACPVEAIG
ncbi:MAG: hypothetical protein FD161_1243 [Limisphaerales bacterium]|nr:MAG: hypothetical protein FD161_1243 [Limisphaerales bacterium]TXT49515.1 MAG: hypothetical protein FD140_3047 [Limisphaerales bacterium]